MYSEPFHNDTNKLNCNLKLLFTNGNHVQFGYSFFIVSLIEWCYHMYNVIWKILCYYYYKIITSIKKLSCIKLLQHNESFISTCTSGDNWCPSH